MRSNKAHRLLALLLAFVMTFSLLPTVTWAANETNGDCSATDGSSSVTWSYDADAKTLTIRGKGAMKDYGLTSNIAPWREQSYVNDITKVVIGDGVTAIGSYAFYKMTGITDAIIAPWF